MINSTKERIKTFNKLKTINLPLLTLSSIRIEFLQIIAKFSDISDEISDTWNMCPGFSFWLISFESHKFTKKPLSDTF